MSQVTLLTADRPMPLYTSPTGNFSVGELNYYRSAVELLGLDMKPFQYELLLEDTDSSAKQLRDYLHRHVQPGSVVQLWNLWVGDANVRAFRLTGNLDDLDGDTLQQLRERNQTCMTITL